MQHDEIHPNNNLTTPKQHSTETILQQHLIITIEQHGEIHNQLHNKVKYTEITQHCEILKHLHYIVKFTNDIKESKDSPNRNCKNSCSCFFSILHDVQLYIIIVVEIQIYGDTSVKSSVYTTNTL